MIYKKLKNNIEKQGATKGVVFTDAIFKNNFKVSEVDYLTPEELLNLYNPQFINGIGIKDVPYMTIDDISDGLSQKFESKDTLLFQVENSGIDSTTTAVDSIISISSLFGTETFDLISNNNDYYIKGYLEYESSETSIKLPIIMESGFTTSSKNNFSGNSTFTLFEYDNPLGQSLVNIQLTTSKTSGSFRMYATVGGVLDTSFKIGTIELWKKASLSVITYSLDWKEEPNKEDNKIDEIAKIRGILADTVNILEGIEKTFVQHNFTTAPNGEIIELRGKSNKIVSFSNSGELFANYFVRKDKVYIMDEKSKPIPRYEITFILREKNSKFSLENKNKSTTKSVKQKLKFWKKGV